MRIAVIGAGIAGLGAAHRLSESYDVTLFEAAAHAGGHANTVDVTLDGKEFPVDTGFLVFNERTYPNLLALFERLEVPIAASDMSFSASIGELGPEWCGSNLASLFARPANALSPRFWGMLRDIRRFNVEASALARGDDAAEALRQPLDSFLARNRYGTGFRDWYLLPMAAAIWSCPIEKMGAFPLGSFVRFFHNHGLLQVSNRPQWFTVRGGSRRYVDRMLAKIGAVRLATPVLGVRRPAAGGALVTTRASTEAFDAVVLATHSTQILSMLGDADPVERELLSAVSYQPNRAVLHTDARLMPRRRAAWAAWNYASDGDGNRPSVSVTYWLNRLQPLPFSSPLMVSLNPLREPEPSRVIAEFAYEHPVFDTHAVNAQRRLGTIQGSRATWFAGAWTGYGFHEDGLKSGLAAAGGIESRFPALAAAA